MKYLHGNKIMLYFVSTIKTNNDMNAIDFKLNSEKYELEIFVTFENEQFKETIIFSDVVPSERSSKNENALHNYLVSKVDNYINDIYEMLFFDYEIEDIVIQFFCEMYDEQTGYINN